MIRPAAHDDDALECLGHEAHVVADGDHRPSLAATALHHRPHALDAPRVLPGGRLVEHEHRRPHGQDRCERQQLAARPARGRTGSCPPRRRGRSRRARRPPPRAAPSPERPRLRGPNSTSARTEPAKICRSGSWNTSPTRAASWATVSAGGVGPADRARGPRSGAAARSGGGRASSCRCRSGR